MTSKDINWSQNSLLKQIQNLTRNKNFLKAGSIEDNIEIND